MISAALLARTFGWLKQRGLSGVHFLAEKYRKGLRTELSFTVNENRFWI
ncbi:MAG: hypothetical protein ACD_23C01343G0002 [uncultured bacterium]|nr:MAG: hypothetical protein ACD_23C01343G0002 [uncultured bacterium]